MRNQSKTRAKQMRLYIKAKREFMLAHPSCQSHCAVFGMLARTPKATDIHHTRGRIGYLLLATIHWLAVCRACHIWIGNNPKSARDLGLIADLGQWNQTEKLQQQKERQC